MEPRDYQHPDRECDLIMKGGITSGVVYPPAVLELGRSHRFRSIGGTSAGAIAAAAAAAAEYGRATGGFEKLGAMSAWIGQDGHLRDLFQPSAGTRPLMETLFALMQRRKPATAGGGTGSPLLGGVRWLVAFLVAAARHDGGPFALGAAIGALAGALVALAEIGPAGGSPVGTGLIPVAILAAVGALLGALIAVALHLGRILTSAVRANGYGLCNGRRDEDAPGGSAVLTDWLGESINDLAGLPKDGSPLTFKDLEERGVTLRMMTSDLSQGRPYVLPLSQGSFLFHEDEMRRLFPEHVVAHLIAHAQAPQRIDLGGLPGYHYLPTGDELPVIVATRMSLSFPLLLSAIPLYTIPDAARGTPRLQPGDLQRNWFSDGGIASNFPIHFFDAWLPTRPTFGIKLTSVPPAAVPAPADGTAVDARYTSMREGGDAGETAPIGAQDVALGAANRAVPIDWRPIEGLASFLAAIFTTAQNYRDNLQAELPSYRDRIVQVRLADDEGGLNLAMGSGTIARVAEKGRRAGEALGGFDFDHHRWVRFQVLMTQLEEQLRQMERAYTETRYDALLEAGGAPDSGFPYPRTGPWAGEARRRIGEVRRLCEALDAADRAWQEGHTAWGDRPFFAHATPKPEPVLRVTANT